VNNGYGERTATPTRRGAYPPARPLKEAPALKRREGEKRPAFDIIDMRSNLNIKCPMDHFFGECLSRLIQDNPCDNKEIMELAECLVYEDPSECPTFSVVDDEAEDRLVLSMNVDLAICLGNYLVDVITSLPPPNGYQERPNRNPGIPAIMALGNRLANLQP
jgi:hypothetical protein